MLLDIFEEYRPDVILLQEVRHTWYDRPGGNQARWIATELGYHWFFRPANVFWPCPPVVEGLALLTKEPLEWVRWFRIPHLPKSGPARVIIHAGYSGLDLYNVHFPLTPGGREAAATELIRIINSCSRGPALIAGDFNARPKDPEMVSLAHAGFRDLWPLLASKQWPTADRIDYLLGHNREWRGSVQSIVGNGRRASDHPGIIADLE